MADNDTTQQTTAAIDLEHLRPLLKEIIATEITGGLSPILRRLEQLERDSADTARRLEVTRSEMKALDSAYRDVQNRYVEAVQSANQIVGTFKGVQDMLDTWVKAAAENGRAIIVLQEGYADLRRDLYGDPKLAHTRSVMGELEKLPAYIQGAIKTEVQPVVNRLAINEARTMKAVEWIEKQNARRERVQGALGLIINRKTVAVLISAIVTYVGYSGATQTSVLYQITEILKALGGG